MLASKYSLPELALYNLETMTTAVVQNSLVTNQLDATPSWNQLMTRLAGHSREHYRALVHDNPDLVAFFQQVTPIEEISKLQISSRPARRKTGAKDLSSLRAIPWVFGWTQSRFLLPSWFGVGTALAAEVRMTPNNWICSAPASALAVLPDADLQSGDDALQGRSGPGPSLHDQPGGTEQPTPLSASSSTIARRIHPDAQAGARHHRAGTTARR